MKQYNPKTYPVSNINMQFLDDEYQDSNIRQNELRRTKAERTHHSLEEVLNASENNNISFSRNSTYVNYFLDGTRRAYYLCDMATSDGTIVPIIAGQISSAILKRNRTDGKLELHKYIHRGLLLIPKGGGGLNEGDADEIKSEVEKNFSKYNLFVEFVTMRNKETPQNNFLAKLNMEMQNLEVKFLEEMTNDQEVNQSNMIIVDGALQFQNIKREKIGNLRYAVGLSKNFNLHLTNVIGKTKEIGTLLVNLSNVGDRTVAYSLQMDNGNKYAFWYLRLRPKQYLNYPFAGIVKVEKALVTEAEKEDGLETDEIDNLSRCLLLETTVCSYGNDPRWASHIYPIYLTEQIQKNKFINDLIFKSFFY